MELRIKAGAIKNLTDARYFSSKAVEWAGFCFDPDSPDFIHPQEAQQIIGWLHGPGIIGEFGLQPAAQVRETAMILNLQGVQVDAGYPPHELETIRPAKIIRIIINPDTTEDSLSASIKDYVPFASTFLLSFSPEFSTWEAAKSNPKLSTSFLAELCQKREILLDFTFATEDFNDVIDTIRPAGIQLRGGEEIKTGAKSFAELDEFFSLVQNEL